MADGPAEGGNMIVYCNVRSCVWNSDGECSGPKQPAGHTALYIDDTFDGAMCSDRKDKEDDEET